MGAYDHQDVPFETLVEQLQPPRSLAYAPVFQAMLVLQNAPASEVRIPDLEIRVEPAPHTGTSKFDLVLSLEEGSEGICCTLEYNTDLFEAATIRRMLGHYEKLLEGMAAAPDSASGNYRCSGTRRDSRSWRRGTTRGGPIRGSGASTSCSRSRSSGRRNRWPWCLKING